MAMDMNHSTMEMARERNDQTYRFIELIQERPSIWDIRCNAYKDRVLRTKDLEGLAQDMGWTVGQVCDKYKNLRTYYTKERRKLDNSIRSGARAEDTYRCRWEFFDAIDAFLHNSLKARRMDCEVIDNESKCGYDDDEKGHGLLLDMLHKDDIEPNFHQSHREEDLMNGYDRPRITSPPIPTISNTDQIFGELIVSELHGIPDGRQKQFLKIKIQQLIAEVKYGKEETP